MCATAPGSICGPGPRIVGRTDEDPGEADLRVLRPPRLDHAVERSFGRRVHADARPRRADAGDRRQEHRGTGRLLQVREGRTRDEGGAHDVGLERPSPPISVGVGERDDRDRTGRVDEVVEAAEAFDGLVDDALALGLVGDVTLQADRGAARRLGDLLARALATRRERHVGSRLTQRLADDLADAGRSTDDEHAPADQTLSHSHPPPARPTLARRGSRAHVR